jgi:hypothetical protein
MSLMFQIAVPALRLGAFLWIGRDKGKTPHGGESGAFQIRSASIRGRAALAESVIQLRNGEKVPQKLDALACGPAQSQIRRREGRYESASPLNILA